jgi:hypothetical protein
MWSVYNALTDRIGLDTVRNLEVNVVLFAAVGLVIGFGAARLRGRFVEAGRAASPEPHDEQQQSSSSERA